MIAFFENMTDLSSMNDLLNCLMSLMLPFAVIPAITFTSSRDIMGSAANPLIGEVVQSRRRPLLGTCCPF